MKDDLKKLIDFTGVSLSDLGLAEGQLMKYRYALIGYLSQNPSKHFQGLWADQKKIDINQLRAEVLRLWPVFDATTQKRQRDDTQPITIPTKELIELAKIVENKTNQSDLFIYGGIESLQPHSTWQEISWIRPHWLPKLDKTNE